MQVLPQLSKYISSEVAYMGRQVHIGNLGRGDSAHPWFQWCVLIQLGEHRKSMVGVYIRYNFLITSNRTKYAFSLFVNCSGTIIVDSCELW